ncbi:MAG: DUF86 domain-containing protein [Myxococcales bacterium]|nr:DUF86 domain-containing protein [Myxococcales bacterium]
MVDAAVVSAKLEELERRIARVRHHAKPTPAELEADPDALELVAFNLMLAVQACLDIASHLVADEGLAPAATLAESFQRLGEHGVLSTETAASLARAAGLRNVVAHAYGAIDVARLHAAATDGLADLERFAREVAAWTQASQAEGRR